jgi:hypothetical protein
LLAACHKRPLTGRCCRIPGCRGVPRWMAASHVRTGHIRRAGHGAVGYRLARSPAEVVRARPRQATRTSAGGKNPKPTLPPVLHRCACGIRARPPLPATTVTSCGERTSDTPLQVHHRVNCRYLTRPAANRLGSNLVRVFARTTNLSHRVERRESARVTPTSTRGERCRRWPDQQSRPHAIGGLRSG